MGLEIVIADEQTLFRKALISVLEKQNEYKIVGEATDGEDFMKIMNDISPGMILLDLSIPKVTGYALLRWLKKRNENIKILIISSYTDDISIGKAIEEGANGYLHKSAGGEEILFAINSIMEKGFYHTDRTHLAMINRLKTGKKKNPNSSFLNMDLAEREIKMIQLFSEGLSNSEIGKIFFMSPRTVETIRQKMIKKSGAKNIIGLVLLAAKHGLIDF